MKSPCTLDTFDYFIIFHVQRSDYVGLSDTPRATFDSTIIVICSLFDQKISAKTRNAGTNEAYDVYVRAFVRGVATMRYTAFCRVREYSRTARRHTCEPTTTRAHVFLVHLCTAIQLFYYFPFLSPARPSVTPRATFDSTIIVICSLFDDTKSKTRNAGTSEAYDVYVRAFVRGVATMRYTAFCRVREYSRTARRHTRVPAGRLITLTYGYSINFRNDCFAIESPCTLDTFDYFIIFHFYPLPDSPVRPARPLIPWLLYVFGLDTICFLRAGFRVADFGLRHTQTHTNIAAAAIPYHTVPNIATLSI